MKIKTIITDGTQPIGNGIGSALEAKDVLLVLQNDGPKDLKEKSIYMSGIILEMAGHKKGKQEALEILQSGKAYKKFKEIIEAQGGNPNIQPEDIKLGIYKHTFNSPKSGTISNISNKQVIKIAKIVGAPNDKGSGVYLHKKVNDKVIKKEPLFTIYSESREKLSFALKENLNEIIKIN